MRPHIVAIEIGSRAFYTGDSYHDIVQRARLALFLAVQEKRQQALLAANPQALLIPDGDVVFVGGRFQGCGLDRWDF